MQKIDLFWPWCLKSLTSIWPSFGNINSIQKVKNMELEQKEWSKLAKIGLIFALKKLDFYIFSKICQGLIWQLFLWLPMYHTNNNSLTKFIIQDRCGGRDARVAWHVHVHFVLGSSCSSMRDPSKSSCYWQTSVMSSMIFVNCHNSIKIQCPKSPCLSQCHITLKCTNSQEKLLVHSKNFGVLVKTHFKILRKLRWNILFCFFELTLP